MEARDVGRQTTVVADESGRNGRAVRSLDELAVAEDNEAWRARTRIFLQPIAAPSIMGLGGFMIATLMVGAWQAGWYGNSSTPLILWPFALFAGGVLQSIAAVASFRARDGAAVAVHTAWGSFWMGWGILQLLTALHVMPAVALGTANPTFAFWFIALTLITIWVTLASVAQSILLTITAGTLSAGAALTAAGFWAGNLGTTRAGGWLFVVSAMAAWLVVGALVMENSFGRTIIPLGKWSKAGNIPGKQATVPIEYPEGMPGSRVGQ
jgi:succinate-acetate transporter protein